MQNLEALVDFFIEIDALKKTMRFSTCPENVRDSSADHSWKLAFMAAFLGLEIKDVNASHAVQICLAHDLAEYLAGEIDSYRIVRGEMTKKQKYQMEEKAMQEIAAKAPGIGPIIYDLWIEFEKSQTPEAKYANALDKIEALTHMLKEKYIAREDNDEAELTATYADKAVQEFPQLKPLLAVIKSRLKQEFQKQGYEWKPHYEQS